MFTSAALAVPPLVYLLVPDGCGSASGGGAGSPALGGEPVWPVWALARRDLFLVGFRVGLNVQTRASVIDVGYAGVIGADRILDGEAPYGHMPQ